jgi:hypothetical protein
MKLNPKSKKALILDFALEDSRKINSRKKKIELIKEINKNKKNESAKQAEDQNDEQKLPTKEEQIKLITKPKEEKDKIFINDIKDINLLKEIYSKTISRGKKQRIKQKLRALGFNEPLESSTTKNLNTNPAYAKPEIKENFITTKIETGKTNINKKIVDSNKQKKKVNTKEIIPPEKDIKMSKTLESSTDKKKTMLKKKRERNDVKTEKFKFKDEIYSDDSDDENMDMNPYYNQIMEKLKK